MLTLEEALKEANRKGCLARKNMIDCIPPHIDRCIFLRDEYFQDAFDKGKVIAEKILSSFGY